MNAQSPFFDLAQEAALNRRLALYETLETARRSICSYSGDPCDCKYGYGPETPVSSEQNGCPELRDLIKHLTGHFPYHRGQSVADDLETIRAASFVRVGIEQQDTP